MVKINQILSYNNVNYKRVSITAIKNILIQNSLFTSFNNRKKIKIYTIPCKANIFSNWIEFFSNEIVDIGDFNKWINEVSAYNCNNEMGKYLHYYIEQE